MKIIKEPIPLVRVGEGLVYNPTLISGNIECYRNNKLAEEITKQIPRRTKGNTTKWK